MLLPVDRSISGEYLGPMKNGAIRTENPISLIQKLSNCLSSGPGPGHQVWPEQYGPILYGRPVDARSRTLCPSDLADLGFDKQFLTWIILGICHDDIILTAIGDKIDMSCDTPFTLFQYGLFYKNRDYLKDIEEAFLWEIWIVLQYWFHNIVLKM